MISILAISHLIPLIGLFLTIDQQCELSIFFLLLTFLIFIFSSFDTPEDANVSESTRDFQEDYFLFPSGLFS